MALFRGDGGAGTGSVTNTPFPIGSGGTGATTSTEARENLGVTATGQDTTYAYRSNNLSDLASASTARTNLGLGTAAVTEASAYATAAQGALADSAIQPEDLADVATSGSYDDLSDAPTLGTAAAEDVGYFATAAQGLLADSAIQAADLADVATSGDYADLSNTPSIPESLTDLGITDGTNGQVLTTDGAGNFTFETAAGSGTVTSVALTVPTGFAISGSPVTTSGTLAVSFDTGYALPTSAKQTEWDTAYGWGDHSAAGYLTSYTETDPVFSVSEAASITSTDTSNWDTAYGWGNHASAGYLTSYTETDPVVGAISGIVKANGVGVISAAVAGTDYLATDSTISGGTY